MAIDKQAIVDAVLPGSGIVAKNPMPPTVWSYDDRGRRTTYDPEAPGSCSTKRA